MSAVLELRPDSSTRYVSLENPRTFTIAITRQQWRDLPFELITGETCVLDGPILKFAERDLLLLEDRESALDLHLKMYRRALRTGVSTAIAHGADQIRRAHIAIVNLAIGYTWPGNPPGHIEFAE